MGNLRVLLVDDEEELVFAMVERLEYRGFYTEAVLSGAEAIERAETVQFDILVIDVKMPGMNGIETMKKIKAKQPNAKVILITGHGSTNEGEEGIAEGAVDYLQKPVKIEDLVQRINSALGMPR
jgi:two-component system OmpR family response regulator